MPEILKSNPLYAALFAIAVIGIVIFIVDVNYRYFTKRCLDFLLALIITLVCGIPLAVLAVISKRRVPKGESAVLKEPYLGAKGKIIFVRRFAGINGRLSGTARILDVLCGNMSFVGIKLMPIEDGAFIDDAYMTRFGARPGLISHLVCGGDAELTYEEMFVLDARYAKKRELFTDFWIAIKSLGLVLRGERNYFGETKDETYAQALAARGAVTEEHLQKSREYAQEALEDYQAAKERKKKL